MLSNKPYLIRAFYDWIVDSSCTPFILVNATYPNCKVPQQFIENGEITLNISPEAVRDLITSKDSIEFRASFSGVVHIVYVPIKAVLAIYATENQQGMFFDYEEEEGGDEWSSVEPASEVTEASIVENKRPPHLRLVD